jgi:hypothetical protein
MDDFMEARPLPRGPIEAPYEGFRVWRDEFNDPEFFPISSSRPVWQGRGRPPFAGIDPGQRGYGPAGNWQEMQNVPVAFGGNMDWAPSGARSPFAPRPPRFFFDDYEISRNPFGPNERMPQWYVDDMMQNWR